MKNKLTKKTFSARLLIFFALMGTVVISIACSLTGHNSNNTSAGNNNHVVNEENDFSQLSFIPYGYQLVDIGNGMNQGVIFLAVENSSDRPFRSNKEYNINASVETKEGAVYTTKLNTNHMGFLDFSHLGRIPPKFRFDDIVISWESSQAATPTSVILSFTQIPNFKIKVDLPLTIGTSINFPYDTPPTTLNSVTSLKGVVLEDNPDGLKLTLTGECQRKKNNNTRLVLLATLENQDKFYPHNEEELLTKEWEMSSFYSNKQDSGLLIRQLELTGELGWTKISDNVGPGQSSPMTVNIGGTGGTVLVWWTDNINYSLYDISVCH